MKNLLLIFVLAITMQSVIAQQTVTINVDVSDIINFDPATRDLYWAGAFDGWNEAHLMTNTSGNIYSVTFTDVPSGYYGGDAYHDNKGVWAWGTHGEWSGGPTGLDIMAYVGDEDVIINTKWGETYDLTVSVDMNNVDDFTPGSNNVYFLSNEIKLHETQMLDDNADGIYTVTFTNVPSGHFPAVFGYGSDTENLTVEWSYTNNKGGRVIVVDGANANESYEFKTDVPVLGKSVTFNVDVSGVDFDESVKQLDIAGDIDGWPLHTMSKTADDIYTFVYSDVAPGYYKSDAYQNPIGNKDDWGATYGEWSGGPTGIDIITYVGDEDVVINTKWGETYDFTLELDMNAVAGFNSASDKVYFINPDLNSEKAPWHETELLDANADGIYSVTFNNVPSAHIATVFAYGPDTDHLTYEWDYDTEKGNRIVKVEGANVNELFTFGDDGVLPTVTINVDVSGIDFDESAHQIDIAGTIDSWAMHSMEKIGEDLYSFVYTDVASGYYLSDAYHNSLGQAGDWGTYGEWSGFPTGIDIMAYVGYEDVVITTKWGETYDLTVEVNMNSVAGFTVGSEKVYLICDDINPITETELLDGDGDGIYSYTFTGMPSGHFPVVFAYGSDLNNLTSEWDYATNKGRRVINVEGESVTKSYVFSSSIVTAIDNDVMPTNVSIYPNPVADIMFIETSSDNKEIVTMYDISGNMVYTSEISSGRSIDVSLLKSGIYFVKVGTTIKKVVKK